MRGRKPKPTVLKLARKASKPPKRPRSQASVEPNIKKSERPPHPGEAESIAERRMRAFGLRKAGASYRQIAQQLSVSLNTAWADVNAELLELRSQTQSDAAEVRDLELQRCDEMILGLWPAVRRGDPKSTLAACRVMDRRARLLGLDAPTKQEHTGTLEIDYIHVRESLAGRIASLTSRLGAGAVARQPE